ncbi:MAG: hypothetical protein IPI27_09515 [Betaproteobacteria bacterium]|nr:hypothetical protein [Betaproteobacteria bacterium]
MNGRRNDDLSADDARFDAAWRSVSNEEPPPALDAALRAAARREVGAGPLRAENEVPEATRPERWWFPLAAAATIGAIALGLLQIVGTEGLFDGGTSTVVSDIPPGTTSAKREAAADAPSPPPQPTPATDAPIARGLVIPPAATGYATAPKPAADTEPSTPPRPEAKLIRRQVAEALPDPARADAAAPSAPGKPAVARVEPAPAAAAPAAAAETSKVRSDADAGATPPPAVAPRSPQSAVAPPAAARLAATPSERRRDDAVRDAQDARPPLPVADWIALIRRLRDEGKLDEATRELAAFRRAHADHLQLLPPDLARWRPDAQ